ncbi:hypothetical protein JZ751_012738 [Albula glossodonta]|uniref:Protein kinase domain-containing protein n=1 Tax=Albula glossodonta TaxID=121402 RepID=A0A8T2N6E2_9TELE|nr:hypothetical protein JZ751_012738 [Albula glossodonta]
MTASYMIEPATSKVCVKKSTQERLALKILIDRPKARNEVRLHMMCASHPNIVQIMEVYANSVQFPHESSPRARLLIVMEMMEGGELFHRISQHRHFTEKMASQVTKQVGPCASFPPATLCLLNQRPLLAKHSILSALHCRSLQKMHQTGACPPQRTRDSVFSVQITELNVMVHPQEGVSGSHSGSTSLKS